MKKVSVCVVLVLLVVISIGVFFYIKKQTIISPVGHSKTKEKPFDKYKFTNLIKQEYAASTITLGRETAVTPLYTSQLFYFPVTGKLFNTTTPKRVSGLANVPTTPGTYPVIVMFRGFVPKEIYAPGIGSQPSARVFAENGFITLSPDFLSYGESDTGSLDSIEDRLQTYPTAITLLHSINNLQAALDASYSGKIKVDTSKVGIWAHSNGGHIALSVLAITGMPYPTVLWAPVSKPFPFSILFFTDDFDDHGKALRKVVANFENDYNPEDFSPPNFYDRITAPLQVHQGLADEAVPFWWSDQLNSNFVAMKKDIEYFRYPGNDHNLQPDAWGVAVGRSLSFYKAKLK